MKFWMYAGFFMNCFSFYPFFYSGTVLSLKPISKFGRIYISVAPGTAVHLLSGTSELNLLPSHERVVLF